MSNKRYMEVTVLSTSLPHKITLTNETSLVGEVVAGKLVKGQVSQNIDTNFWCVLAFVPDGASLKKDDSEHEQYKILLPYTSIVPIPNGKLQRLIGTEPDDVAYSRLARSVKDLCNALHVITHFCHVETGEAICICSHSLEASLPILQWLIRLPPPLFILLFISEPEFSEKAHDFIKCHNIFSSVSTFRLSTETFVEDVFTATANIGVNVVLSLLPNPAIENASLSGLYRSVFQGSFQIVAPFGRIIFMHQIPTGQMDPPHCEIIFSKSLQIGCFHNSTAILGDSHQGIRCHILLQTIKDLLDGRLLISPGMSVNTFAESQLLARNPKSLL